MKKLIILSLIIMCSGIVIGRVFSNWMLTVKICGILGFVCFCIAGILNGSFISGDRIRANSSIDTSEDKIQRSKITNFVIAVGLPNIILAVIVFLMINKS